VIDMAQQTEIPMKKISIAKVVLNMGVGKSGDPIEKAKVALEHISGQKPSTRSAKATYRDWGVRKGEPIGVAVTIRDEPAIVLIKRLFAAKGNQINGSSFDNFGNLSFGIKEHIDIPGVKYDPQVGILGLDISISLTRPGFNIRFRSKHKASIGRGHIITAEDAKAFLTREFGIQVV
jgi:large subunit ribosomal protein L5